MTHPGSHGGPGTAAVLRHRPGQAHFRRGPGGRRARGHLAQVMSKGRGKDHRNPGRTLFCLSPSLPTARQPSATGMLAACSFAPCQHLFFPFRLRSENRRLESTLVGLPHFPPVPRTANCIMPCPGPIMILNTRDRTPSPRSRGSWL